MTLHVAIRILCNEFYLKQHADYAQSLLEHFVESFKIIYGADLVSHNVHGLIHLVDDAKNLGPLDSFSAFPFENFMRTLKHDLRKHEKPLQQLHRRYTEKCRVTDAQISGPEFQTKYEYRLIHRSGPILEAAETQFGALKTAHWIVTVKEPDNCCKVGETVVIVNNFVNNSKCNRMMVVGKRYLSTTDIYDKPCCSSVFGSVLVSNLSSNLEMWPVSEITTKCLRIPFREGFAVFPLLHCNC